MEVRIIKSPTSGTIEMLNRRRTLSKPSEEYEKYDTIGLVQGKLIDMIVAADIAEKAAGVFAEEIRGVCPQHFVLLALFGDTASVEAAVNAIKEQLSKA